VVTHFAVTVTILVGIVGILLGFAGFLRWVFKRGVDWEKVTNSIDALTKSADKLTGAFDEFSTATGAQMAELERRILVLETRTLDKPK
jgi:hypothetical protein